jgi:hypothetical protein
MLRPVVPPLNCNFQVEFKNPDFKNDTRFHIVQGLHVRRPVAIPFADIPAHFDNIVLKRAYEPDSKLLEWFMNAINNKITRSENLTIFLLNSKLDRISAWKVEKAIPVSWGVEELHAQETKILLESFELRYEYFEVVDSRGNVIAPKNE